MTLLDMALANAGSAAVLGGAAVVVARFVRRPEVLHAVWLIVLLDLLAPPIFGIGLLPAHGAGSPALGSVVTSGPGLEGRTFGSAIVVLWIAGAAAVVGLALLRATRFARGLARGRRPTTEISARLGTLSRAAGLTRPPRALVVDAIVPPLVRIRIGQPEIVLPSGLLERLEPGERDAILAHELAHLRRRDPWVRVVELAATSAFWWNPLVFVARRALRRAEEACCDGWVLRLLPDLAVDYARALVKTAEFLSGSREPSPALASGAGDFRHMEERLTMILNAKPPKRLRTPVRVAIALLAAVVLLSFPTRGDEKEPSVTTRPTSPEASIDSLEEQELAFELQQRAVELRLAEIESEVERLHESGASRDAVEQRRRVEADRRRVVAEAEALRELAASRSREQDEAREMDRARLELERARRVAVEHRSQAEASKHASRESLSAQAARLRAALAEVEREIEALEIPESPD